MVRLQIANNQIPVTSPSTMYKTYIGLINMKVCLCERASV